MTMKPLLIAASLAALAAAGQAQAQVTITLNGSVDQICVLGAPDQVAVNIGDMTDNTGKLKVELTGSDASSAPVSVEIDDAFCNTPSILSVEADALALQNAPSYGTPAGFSRAVTFDASVDGWPSNIVYRPAVHTIPSTSTAAEARASALEIKAFDLETLNGAGTAESPNLILEAGDYSGAISLTLGVN